MFLDLLFISVIVKEFIMSAVESLNAQSLNGKFHDSESLKNAYRKEVFSTIHVFATSLDEGFQKIDNVWYKKETITTTPTSRHAKVPIIIGYTVRKLEATHPGFREIAIAHIDFDTHQAYMWEFTDGVLKYVAPGEQTITAARKFAPSKTQ